MVAEDGGEPIAPWRLHDLRRTLATGFQRLGVRFEVTEAVLNHVGGSRAGVAGIYQRHDWTTEKREAFDLWNDHVVSILAKTDGVITGVIFGKAESVTGAKPALLSNAAAAA